ncbi:hypothetical protein GH714_014250 [Hevea brasiliensis]|uniref:Uncharacterized protein n=1 Tax=Hevea brasiliensis TaxID=3981 RepID=A0A6A6MDJ8_HEVBR|nr:hypothetical protein GH714_014250 [Hevea brasiliensis]
MSSAVTGKESGAVPLQGMLPNSHFGNKRLEFLRTLVSKCLFVLPFQQLKMLDLYYNNIAGCIKNEGFEMLSTLKNLEFLNLGVNKFNTNILSSLSHLSSLKYLYLYGNEMKGRIDIQELNNLTNLKELNIVRNKIEGFKSLHGGEKLLNMSDLEYLYLSDNNFSNDILSSIKGLSSLKTLWIRYNLLKGPFNLTELDAMSNLEELNLSGNNITKFISSRGSKVINVKELYLDGSSLGENFLQSLEVLSSLRLLSLRRLNCTNQSKPQQYARGIPSWINNFSQLSYLILGHNNIEAKIPIQLCNLTQLSLIDLSHNHLSGPILPCLRSTSNSYRQQDGSYNASAPVSMDEPLEFTTKSISYSYQGSMLSYFSGIDLSCNHLTGRIPTEIGNLNEIHAKFVS